MSVLPIAVDEELERHRGTSCGRPVRGGTLLGTHQGTMMWKGAEAMLSPQEQSFATEVKRARGAARVSQDWLGQQIRMSRSKVSEICSGTYLPTHDTVLRLVEALAMDHERTFALWRAARDAREARRSDERDARLAPPTDSWDRLPVLPPEVVSLMRAQMLTAEDLPYRLPGAKRPSLSTVYVRQDLGQPADDALAESRPDQGFGHRRGSFTEPSDRWVGLSPEYVAHQPATGSRGIRPPARAVRTALDGDQNLLVTGGPGQGKSTLTLRLAADVSGMWLDARDRGDVPLVEPVIPLRLPARELAAHLDMPLPEALAKSVTADFGSLLKAEVPARLLAGRVCGCRWLLLIDAIDEIVDWGQQERLLRALAHLAGDKSDPAYRILVTSRPLGGTGLGILQRAGVARYELQPFDVEALRAFADHWFTADGSPDGELLSRRFLTQVKEAHLAELMRIPLLATIAAIISEQRRDRPLPDNRHALYETYLAYIARRGGHNDRSGSAFREVHTPLLEHLGVVRLATAGSLAAAAREWVTEHMPGDCLPMDWQSDLMTYLATAGPMIARRGDLEFLHHSFADHLAATAQARELPPSFDAEQDAWREIVHNARGGYAAAHAQAVLLHYGHLHPSQADEMARWLCSHTADFQLVAARLLAQHLPASASTIDTFLDKVWSWSLTTAGRGATILDEVSKATHHQRLPIWLFALMCESGAPWRSRIQAAVTLCTLFDGEENREALGLLHDVLRDPTIAVADRLTVAQGLAEVGMDQRAQAADGLRALLMDPAIDADSRRTAAVALADLGGQARAFAVGVLLAALEDPTTTVAALRTAAMGLAEIGPEFEVQAVSVLRGIAADRSCAGEERLSAALALGQLGPLYGEEAATLLEGLGDDKNIPMHQRSRAAAVLADLGPEYLSRAAGNLLRLLRSPTTTRTEMWWIASDLAELGPAFQEEAAACLQEILDDPTIYSNARLWTIDSLSKLGIAFHVDAAEEYRRMWADPFAGDYDRCQALANLANLGLGYRDEAAGLLAGTATDLMAGAGIKVEAARMLVNMDPQFHAVAEGILYGIVTDDSLGYGARVRAAASLAGLGNRFHDDIADMLKAALSSPWRVAWPKVQPYDWEYFGTHFKDERLTALRNALRDTSCDPYVRTNAARLISNLDPEGQPEVVSALCAIIRHPFDRRQNLAEVAERLAGFGSEARDMAITTLRTRLADAETELGARRDLAEALAALGDEYLDEAAEELRFICAEPAADFDLRVGAGTALATLGPRFHEEAATLLRALLENTRRVHYHFDPLSSSLAELGLNQRDGVASTLRALLADIALNARDRRYAAIALGNLGPEFRDEGAAALRRLASDPDRPAGIRVEAAWELIDLLHSPQQESTDCLLEISADHCQKVEDRCSAARYLVQTDQRYRPQAILELRSALKAKNVSLGGVLTITAELRQLHAITEEEAYLVCAAVANDPAATSAERRTAITRIDESDRHEDETREYLRALMWDRTASVENRIPGRLELAGIAAPLANDVDSVLNEILKGEEYDASDRIAALRSMERLGGVRLRSAEDFLREAIRGESSASLPVLKALDTLARFGGKDRVEACDIADRMLSDEQRPLRERLAAAKIGLLDVEPRPLAVELLLKVVRDNRYPRRQADAASALLGLGSTWRTDAVSELRGLIQNSDVNGHVRLEAAQHLANWSPPDRTMAAAVVDAIAGDSTAAPALRWRAARSLARRYGVRFRPAGLTHLTALATAQGMSASARIGAAEAMAELDPGHLPTTLKVLRGIAAHADHRPATRIQALAAIGRQGRGFVDEAVAGLREIAHDSGTDLLARLRAAAEMGWLRLDRQEDAALTMREAVRSSGTAVHVRWQAARWLAVVSPMCRDEALAHLAALADEPW